MFDSVTEEDGLSRRSSSSGYASASTSSASSVIGSTWPTPAVPVGQAMARYPEVVQELQTVAQEPTLYKSSVVTACMAAAASNEGPCALLELSSDDEDIFDMDPTPRRGG